VYWRSVSLLHRKSDKMIVNGAVMTRRPKQTWMEAIKNDKIVVDLIEEMALNRAEWKK